MNKQSLSVYREDPASARKDSGAIVVGRAVLGFLVYGGVDWLAYLLLKGALGWFALLLPALLLAAASVMTIRKIWRGFALGVFLGAGLTLLLLGACFIVLSNLKM